MPWRHGGSTAVGGGGIEVAGSSALQLGASVVVELRIARLRCHRYRAIGIQSGSGHQWCLIATSSALTREVIERRFAGAARRCARARLRSILASGKAGEKKFGSRARRASKPLFTFGQLIGQMTG